MLTILYFTKKYLWDHLPDDYSEYKDTNNLPLEQNYVNSIYHFDEQSKIGKLNKD